MLNNLRKRVEINEEAAAYYLAVKAQQEQYDILRLLYGDDHTSTIKSQKKLAEMKRWIQNPTEIEAARNNTARLEVEGFSKVRSDSWFK